MTALQIGSRATCIQQAAVATLKWAPGAAVPSAPRRPALLHEPRARAPSRGIARAVRRIAHPSAAFGRPFGITVRSCGGGVQRYAPGPRLGDKRPQAGSRCVVTSTPWQSLGCIIEFEFALPSGLGREIDRRPLSGSMPRHWIACKAAGGVQARSLSFPFCAASAPLPVLRPPRPPYPPPLPPSIGARRCPGGALGARGALRGRARICALAGQRTGGRGAVGPSEDLML